MSGASRLPEWAVDVLLWLELEVDHAFAAWLLMQAGRSIEAGSIDKVEVKPWHARGNGETDLLVLVDIGDSQTEIHVENKIGAAWSDESQPGRYRDHVTGAENRLSLLVAPQRWLGLHSLGAGLFDGATSYESIADWLSQTDDPRRRWIADRVRSAALPQIRTSGDPAPDIDAWFGRFAEIAAEFDLHPKSSGFTRKAGTPGKDGRFVPELAPWGGPGGPVLNYKFGKPGVRLTRLDLAWLRPPNALAVAIEARAVANGYEVVRSKGGSELYVRVDGGDVFGHLMMVHDVDEQTGEIRSMCEAAVDLRRWWLSVSDEIGIATADSRQSG